MYHLFLLMCLFRFFAAGLIYLLAVFVHVCLNGRKLKVNTCFLWYRYLVCITETVPLSFMPFLYREAFLIN